MKKMSLVCLTIAGIKIDLIASKFIVEVDLDSFQSSYLGKMIDP